MFMIKYRFAKNQAGDLIDIKNFARDKNLHFRCLCCNTEMIPKLGKINIHHFAHKSTSECKGETYLHLLGKKIFYDHYNYCLKQKKPFYIGLYHRKTCNHFESKFNVTCSLNRSLEKIDLTEHFDQIQIEHRESSFIADILLTSKSGKHKLFVEIAVSHFSSENKLSSEFRIIEIAANNEDDFKPIENHFLSEKKPNISFINFNPKDKNESACKGKCDKSFDLFLLDKNGKGKLFQKQLGQIEALLKKEKENISTYYITTDEGHHYYHTKFKYFIAKLYQDGFKVKNCFICRYHARNKSFGYYDDSRGNPIFCKFLKIKTNSNEAVDCEYFRAGQDYIENLIHDGQYIITRSKVIEDENHY